MFTEKERILANEAALTASLLGNGLNSLRRADMYNKGLYYQAFFLFVHRNRETAENYCCEPVSM